MKGETVRGIWARRGWDPGWVVLVGGFGLVGGLGGSLLLLYMFVVDCQQKSRGNPDG